jgi:rubrerythrin
MIVCPNCGKERESNRVRCPNCQYTYRYSDVADYDPESIRFTVLFECEVCGREFKLVFGKGDKVNIKGADYQNTKINHRTGNPISILVDGWNCQPQCPTCERDDSLSISEKHPVRER